LAFEMNTNNTEQKSKNINKADADEDIDIEDSIDVGNKTSPSRLIVNTYNVLDATQDKQCLE
jgi:hypothetical protein